MNLDGFHTRTSVSFEANLTHDHLLLNGEPTTGSVLERVSKHLNLIREQSGSREFARVKSDNNFPTGTGIASSASAFASLTIAACQALSLNSDERTLSRLARRGSGSASRSVPGGFVEWIAGTDDEDSYAYSIAPVDHWDLTDCVAIVSRDHKITGSQAGHLLADSSPYQSQRVETAPDRLDICRKAIRDRDFEALADVVELDSNLMHAVIMTSSPRLLYWKPTTIAVMQAVPVWRKAGLPVCYTIDAGPNVHLICPADYAMQVKGELERIEGIESVITANVGGPAHCTS